MEEELRQISPAIHRMLWEVMSNRDQRKFDFLIGYLSKVQQHPTVDPGVDIVMSDPKVQEAWNKLVARVKNRAIRECSAVH